MLESPNLYTFFRTLPVSRFNVDVIISFPAGFASTFPWRQAEFQGCVDANVVFAPGFASTSPWYKVKNGSRVQRGVFYYKEAGTIFSTGLFIINALSMLSMLYSVAGAQPPYIKVLDITAAPFVQERTLHHAHSRSSACWHRRFRFLDLGDARLCRQQHSRYRSCVLESRSCDLYRVDDAGLDHVLVLLV